MKSLKTKTTTAITILLTLTLAVTAVALPLANAHTPAWIFPTWTYIAIAYNPIGINQETLVIFWSNAYPPTATGTFGDRWTFYVDITRPDSSNETLGPFTSDPVGGGWTSYTPTQVGTYTIVARMLEHKITGLPMPLGGSYFMGSDVYINDTYLASTSNPVYLIVQQEERKPWAEAPLPTQFWTRPINSMNRNWQELAGNWLAGAAQNIGPTSGFGYGKGPESAHVMWATPMWAGGLMDARFGDVGYAGIHYEGLFFTPPIILNGKLYYNVQSYPREGWCCLDLYTGKHEYFHNTTGPVTIPAGAPSAGEINRESLAFGQIYIFDCPNQHGGFPYLWSTTAATANTWMMFDAYTGNYMCSIANVSAGGTAIYGKEGSILRYNIVGSGANKRLTVWNSTQAIWWKGTQQQWDKGNWSGVFQFEHYWYWRPVINTTYDGSHGFFLNASIPDVQGSIRAVREDQYVIGGTAGSNNEQGIVKGNLWALNLKPDSDGHITPRLLWNITFTPPSSAGNKTISMRSVDPEDGVFLFSCTQTRQWWGYSLETGQQIWGPTASESQLQFYALGERIYQGKLISWGYGGELRAYNITTGELQWIYNATGIGFESPYGNYPIGIGCIADGKIYVGNAEHSPTQPLYRGAAVRCVNASNGAELWKFSLYGVAMATAAGGSNFAIADGYLVALNIYDNQLYCFGKGPSATTVTASPKVSAHGSTVLVEGTVTDQSPSGRLSTDGDLNSALKGTPAIADENMQAWMEYLYMQQAMPTDAKGVDVSLDTVDPNGNYVHIGTVTSDMNGNYGYAYTPEVPGTYQIIATFAGSNSYYGSSSTTYLEVSEAPAATAPPEYPQPIDNTMTIVYATIAIIIAIALGVIWIRRK